MAWATSTWAVGLARCCRRRFDPRSRSFSLSSTSIFLFSFFNVYIYLFALFVQLPFSSLSCAGSSWLPLLLVSFPSFSLFPTPNRPCQSERSSKARHEADSFEPAEWSERLTPGQSGWLGAAAVGSIPALALSLFLHCAWSFRVNFLLVEEDRPERLQQATHQPKLKHRNSFYHGVSFNLECTLSLEQCPGWSTYWGLYSFFTMVISCLTGGMCGIFMSSWKKNKLKRAPGKTSTDWSCKTNWSRNNLQPQIIDVPSPMQAMFLPTYSEDVWLPWDHLAVLWLSAYLMLLHLEMLTTLRKRE